jgi:Zinc finger, ZZ type/Zinc finger, C3HC4 type (RING finger)
MATHAALYHFAESNDISAQGYDGKPYEVSGSVFRSPPTEVHNGVACDGCLATPLVGIRHSCLVCPGLDFCGSCVTAGMHPPQHPLLATPKPLHPTWASALQRLIQPRSPTLLVNMDAAPGEDTLSALNHMIGLADAVVPQGENRRDAAFWEREQLRARADSRRWRGVGAPELLDLRLFTPVKSSAPVYGSVTNTAVTYRPRYDSLCLVSVADGLPIMAVQLVAAGAGLVSALLKPPLAAVPDNLFQGLVSQNNTQVAFALTNLCDAGTLNVDVSKVMLDSLWRVVSSTAARINAANVIRAGETISVFADAATNATFVLQAIVDATGAPLSVAQNADAMANEQKAAVGTYLRVTAVPQRGLPALNARFASGVRWELLDMFVRRPAPPPPPQSQFGISNNDANQPHGFFGGGFGTTTPPLTPFGFGAQGAHPGFGIPAGSSSSGPVLFGAAPTTAQPMPTSPGQAAPVRINLPPVTFPLAAAAPPGAVLAASVASLVAGSTIEPPPVRAADPRLSFDRNQAAEALLGLAVQPALSAATQPCDTGLKARAEELLSAFARNSIVQTALSELGGQFQSDTCVACMESSPPPDALLLPCGHVCLHWEEASRVEACPLCRKFITARVCISDGRFVACPSRPVRLLIHLENLLSFFVISFVF